METCFKFYFFNLYDFCLIAVLICYLYFVMYCRARNVFGTQWRIYFWAKFVVCCLELGVKRGLDCSNNIMLAAMVRWNVFDFYAVLYD